MSDREVLRRFAEHEGSIDELCREHPGLEPGLRELERRVAEAKVRPPREDRYVLLGEVARGGMGVVLHVWDRVLERPVAMKVLDAGAEETAARRFVVEAKVAGQLEHPGVVPVYDLGIEEGGRPYFTMPMIEGRTLDEVFDASVGLTRALLVVDKLCEVMAYAHAQGVIHRDLKPKNVMLGAFGEIYVVDWGLAKVVGSPEPSPAALNGAADPGRTLDGTVSGTPPYMSPEQAHGRVEEVSVRTDVYALGAILYRLLAGRDPYAPRRGEMDPARTIEWIRRGPPTPISRLAPSAPAELAAICDKAMARRPEDRYASVGELARDLDAFLEGRLANRRRRGSWLLGHRR